ncbi:Uncharacterized protein dnm_071380 [Desulfonema magnum]|uniref:Uncharacterized protein n=1 Tax=Desulfonema magnum TaxID=45655 RepID=A0A975BT04_9BACT|nr:Uncharacterized protein dnm_071380 [Desulfonema magnum]
MKNICNNLPLSDSFRKVRINRRCLNNADSKQKMSDKETRFFL